MFFAAGTSGPFGRRNGNGGGKAESSKKSAIMPGAMPAKCEIKRRK
jgi:hypothetical protein